MLSAKSFTPVSCSKCALCFHCSCCPSDPVSAWCLSSLDMEVSQGDIDAQRVPSKSLWRGIAQSYLDRKLHITTTAPTSLLFAKAVKTLRAMPEFPEPGRAVHTCCAYVFVICRHQTIGPRFLTWNFTFLVITQLVSECETASSC